MRYAKLSYTEFYPCYLQQCHSIDLFSYRTPGHGQKGHKDGVRGPCDIVYVRARCFEKNLLPPKWGK